MEKLICPACKAENDGSAKFCPECGSNLEEAARLKNAKKCVQCGAEVEANAAFCPECGANQSSYARQEYGAQESNTANSRQSQDYRLKNEQPQTATTETEALLMRAYITGSTDPFAVKHHYEHYRNAFIKCEKNYSKVGWNWGAFWLSGLNLLYRKSYLWGFIIIIAGYALAPVTSGITSVLAMFLPGMFADSFHYSRYHEKLMLAKSTYPNDPARQISYMAEHGGVNTALPVTFFIIALIIGAVIVAAINDYF
ncbi:MAG: zinc ribbon domain-containing protein [Treponema sp.]